MNKRKKSLTTYLHLYRKLSKEPIRLVYKPSEEAYWNKGVLFLSKEYDPYVPYNHRSILNDEVVIEYDSEDKQKNLSLVRKISSKLQREKKPHSLWTSGNKSAHLHVFINTRRCSNQRLLKKLFIQHYAADGEESPDLQLTGKHLIRAEYGVHEKTGELKSPLFISRGYPERVEVPDEVWEAYSKEILRRKTNSLTRAIKKQDVDSELARKTMERFKESNLDGKGRLVFALALNLKHKYDNPKDLTEELWGWYKYSGGKKLLKRNVDYQVNYAYKSDYQPALYLNWLIQTFEMTEKHCIDNGVTNESGEDNKQNG